jgi:hypothetical protein
MFCFFYKDLFVDFWSNKIGDIFCDLTILSMKWDRLDVDLYYYPSLNSVPEFYEIDSSKKLIIKKEIITIVEHQLVNEDGVTIVTAEQVKTYETDIVIDAVVYCAKGLLVKPC